MNLQELIKTAPEEFQESLKKEFFDIYERSEKLHALENGGVDNWEWYGQSMSDYFGDEEGDD